MLRRHRITITINDTDLRDVKRRAQSLKLPLSTAIYHLLQKALGRNPAEPSK